MAIYAHHVSKLHLAQQASIKTIAWFLACLFLVNQPGCHTPAPRDITSTRGGPNVEYYRNCGLNVGYVTLRLFHKDVDIYKLADEIKAGVHLERNVSLLALKKAFEKYGLIAEAFKADYPEEIIAFSEADVILIVRVDSCPGDNNVGHFIVIKGGRDHVIVIDPPYRPEKFTRKDIIEEGILSGITGEFLVVY